MSTEKQKKANGMTPKRAKSQRSHRKQPHRMSRSLRTGVKAGMIIGVAVIVLGLIYFLNNVNGSSANSSQTNQYPFQVGSPGPGEQAPAIELQSTNGSTFDLASLRGKTVLLFFQEGPLLPALLGSDKGHGIEHETVSSARDRQGCEYHH